MAKLTTTRAHTLTLTSKELCVLGEAMRMALAATNDDAESEDFHPSRFIWKNLAELANTKEN